MNHTVFQFGELTGVPPVGGTHKIAGDALDCLELRAASRTCRLLLVGILIAAVRTVVAVMVYRAVTYIILVHEIHYLHYRLLIVRGVAVNLYIEDMSASCLFMVRAFYTGLVPRRTSVSHGDVIGISIIILVGDTFDYAESLAVAFRESSGKAFRRSCQHGIVMAIALGILIGLLSHMLHNIETEALRLLALSVMLSGKRYQTFGQSYEADAEGALVDYAFYRVVAV